MLVNLCDAVEGEEEFVSLLQASENRVIEGAIQNGEIVEIGDEYAMVAIANEKREAKLRVSEITDKDGNVLFKKNDKIEVFVSPSRQGPIASYVKAQKMKRVAEKIAQLADDYKDKVIEAKVIKKNKGGYIMEYDGIDVFMPRRDSAIREDSKVAGKTYKVAIIKIDKENNSIIVSRTGDKVEVKVLGFDEKKRRLSLSMKALSDDPWTEIEKELEVGYAIKVSVSNIESYGAFVDLGNDIEGFLHISEISWDKNIKHPSRYLKEGQEIDVEIIEIDTKNRRLRVSLKKLLEKPFAQFIKAYQVGSIIKGKVATLTDFGAFIKLGSVDGLLHNEDAYWDKNIKCKDKLKEGDEIEVKIIKIDKENEKISLSQKALLRSPAKEFAQKHKVDEIVKGKVIDIKDFGIFVKIDEMEALIRNEDIYPLKKEEIKLDEEISCVIAHIDEENNKVRASVKKLERQKEKEALKAFSNSEEKMTLGDKLKNRL